MKVQLFLPLMKFHVFVLSLAFLYQTHVNAQDDPVVDYLQQAGDCADIYNGKMEAIYNVLYYKSLPYYMSSDYTDASIVYKSNFFPNQKVRLDLYKEQLILLPPEKQFGIIADFQNVDKVFMYNKTFKRLIPPKGSGIKQGFYIQLLEKENIHLFCKVYFNFEQNIENKKLTYGFDRKVRYYLLYKDQYYSVNNKGSFSKLFPRFKKQINRFAKDNKLDFKQNADESFTLLAGFCEELITSTN